jgi:hypothetical protein
MHEHDSHIERIRTRAHEISQRPDAGSPEENWSRAEAELVAEENALQTAIEAAEEEEAIVLHAGHRNAFTHP